MHQFFRLIIPEKVELLLFGSIGLALLFVQNISGFRALFKGDTVEIVTNNLDNSDYVVANFLNGLEDKINPRVIDLIVWILVGCVVFVVVSVIIASLKSANSEAELLHYYINPKNKAHEIHIFMTKIAIRISGIIGLFIWVFYFAKTISPYFSELFFTSICTLKDPISLLWLLLSFVIYGLCLYVFAILARLIALKPRVLWDNQE